MADVFIRRSELENSFKLACKELRKKHRKTGGVVIKPNYELIPRPDGITLKICYVTHTGAMEVFTVCL